MQYAEHMGRKVGFKVLGDGPTNVLFMPSFVSNLDLIFGTPFVGEFLEGIAEFSRLIVYDKAGTGVSDPLDQLLTLEDRVDEAATVMAAADVEHAVIMGLSEGGPAAILLAATRPELVDGLVIFGSYAFGAESFKEHHLAADHEAMGLSGFLPSGAQLEIMREFDGHVREHWGDGRALGTLTPSLAATATGREHLALYERSSASPGMAKAVWKAAMAVNVLDVLPTIDVPTLVVHFTDDPVPVQGGRLIADRISGARMLELPGVDHAPWLAEDPTGLLAALAEFVTGQRTQVIAQRRVATVLFSDIVGSTQLARELGDQRWRTMLEEHQEMARRVISEHDGDAVKSMGDGFLVTFGGPAAAIRCAAALHENARDSDISLTIGIHTGEIEVLTGDVAGIAVHIAARVASSAKAGQTVVSRTVKDLVIGSGIAFASLGEFALKGLDDMWQLFSVGEDDA